MGVVVRSCLLYTGFPSSHHANVERRHKDQGKYEHDPRGTAGDQYTVEHLHPSSRPNTAALDHAVQTSLDTGLPFISSYLQQAGVLALLCRLTCVNHVLEVGTLGGYAGIWLASEKSDIKVTCIEVNLYKWQIGTRQHRVRRIEGPYMGDLHIGC